MGISWGSELLFGFESVIPRELKSSCILALTWPARKTAKKNLQVVYLRQRA